MKIYQVDAFTSELFRGNPAAVIPLQDEWLETELMQKIASENNLSETVYFISKSGKYHIRWFTPKYEVDLCGHATLAAAYVLKNILSYPHEHIDFESRSGTLGVDFNDTWISLDFPSMKLEPYSNETLSKAVGATIVELYKAKDDVFAVLENEATLRKIQPDSYALGQIDARGIICTTVSSLEGVDFVSRFFAPRHGINEDPVTGSAHTKLIPFWSKRLNKTIMLAHQVSERGGVLQCEDKGARVKISGKAVLYLKGEIFIN